MEHGNYLNVQAEARPSQSGALLNTIKLPRVLRQLTDRLPKPNYESSLSRHHNSGSPYEPAQERRDTVSHNKMLGGAGANITKSLPSSKRPTPSRSPKKAAA